MFPAILHEPGLRFAPQSEEESLEIACSINVSSLRDEENSSGHFE
jgi:hypothetical protein